MGLLLKELMGWAPAADGTVAVPEEGHPLQLGLPSAGPERRLAWSSLLTSVGPLRALTVILLVTLTMTAV